VLGESTRYTTTHYEAVRRVTDSDPQAAAVGATKAEFSATTRGPELAKTATYTHAYAESNGFRALLSDREHLAYALGPEAGGWLQQATPAIRARVPVEGLRDPSDPVPSFSETRAAWLKTLREGIAAGSAVGVGSR
jgi:pyruvate/2-oxoglutarate dehydrogenase complex dihydrolipoamide dehydrogenase (E3) component